MKMVVDENGSRKFSGLEICRFLCALSVIVSHYQHFFVPGLWNDSTGAIQRTSFPLYGLLFPMYQNGGLAVKIFWAISGFIFFWKYSHTINLQSISAKKFFILRFSRLYPLHFFTLILVAFLQYIYFSYTNTTFIYGYNDFYHFILQLFLASNWIGSQPYSFNGPIWSISVEVVTYLIFFMLVRFFNPSLVFCLFVLLITSGALFFTKSPIIQCVNIFFVGGIVHLLISHIEDKYKIILFCFYASSLVAAIWYAYSGFEMSSLYTILITFLVISLFVLLETVTNTNLSAWSWLGNLTYSSYLIHFPIQLVIVIIFDRMGIDRSVFVSPFLLFFFLTITFSLAWVIYRYFEVPMQDRIRIAWLPRRDRSGAH